MNLLALTLKDIDEKVWLNIDHLVKFHYSKGPGTIVTLCHSEMAHDVVVSETPGVILEKLETKGVTNELS